MRARRAADAALVVIRIIGQFGAKPFDMLGQRRAEFCCQLLKFRPVRLAGNEPLAEFPNAIFQSSFHAEKST